MASDISVSIGVKGETQFKKALTECQNTLKQLDSALKANSAQYDANADALGDNVERTKLLQKSIETQKKLAEEMGEAIKYSSEKYGAASTQTTKYVVAQNKAKESIAKLEKELKDADREMEELGRDSIKVGRQLEQGIGDAAEDVSGGLDGMIKQMQTDIGSIKNMASISLAGEIGGGVVSVVKWLDDFAASTRDYRRSMSFVEQHAAEAGIDWAIIKKQITEVNTVTGDTEGAIEGISNLLATGFDSTEMTSAIDALMGAVIRFPETLNFESIADGLQETIASPTGGAVGAYAELLERLGINLGEFNEAMAQATTEEERQQIALSYLANHGLEMTYDGWKKNNGEIIAASEANQKLQDSYAKWGEIIDRHLPKIKNAWAGFLGDTAETVELFETLMDEESFKAYAEQMRQERQAMLDAGTAQTEGEAALRQMGKPEWYIEYYKVSAAEGGKAAGKALVENMIAAVEEAELGAISEGTSAALTSWLESAEKEGGIWSGYAAWLAKTWDTQVAKPMDGKAKNLAISLAGEIGENWEQVKVDASGWADGMADAIDAAIPAAKDASQRLAEGVMEWINTIVLPDIAGWAEEVKKNFEEKQGKTPIEQAQNALEEAKFTGDAVLIASLEQQLKELKAAENAGESVGEQITSGVETVIDEKAPNLKTSGENISAAVANGIAENGSAAITNAETMAAAIQAAIDSISVQTLMDAMATLQSLSTAGVSSLPKGWNLGSGGSGAAESGNPLSVSLNVNGSKFASAIISDINAAQGRQIELTA